MFKRKTHFILVLALFGASCSHYYYAPNPLHVPALKNKEDVHLSVATALTGESSGVDAKAVYSPFKYTAVMLNHTSLANSHKGSTTQDWGRGSLTEAALGGYYHRYPWTFSTFAGYGLGFVENYYLDHFSPSPILGVYSRLSIRRWFVQPGITFQTRFIHLGAGLRFVRLEFPKGAIDYQLNTADLAALTFIEQEAPFTFPEFGISGGLRFRPLRFTMSIARILSEKYDRNTLHFNRITVNMMVTLELQELWQKNPKETGGL